MKLGIYIRVSTEEQKLNGHSIDNQKQRGIDYCEFHKFDYSIYSDAGYSGQLSIDKLPQLSNLNNDLHRGHIDGIYVYKYDRLIRNSANSDIIINTLESVNGKLIVDGVDIDFTNFDQMLILGVQKELAKHEVARLSQRVQIGLRQSFLKGHAGGEASIPYGYESHNKLLVINKEEGEIVKLIYNLSLKGHGDRSICRILNERGVPTKYQRQGLKMNGKTNFYWKDGTINRILKNSIYYGDRTFKGEVVHFPELKIIEKKIQDAVIEKRKKRNSFKNTRNKYFYLLKGLLYCGCGYKMYGKIKIDRGERTYRCNTKRHGAANCGSRGINLDKLNNHVLDRLKMLPEIVDKSFETYKSITAIQMGEYANLKREIIELEKKIDEIFDFDIAKRIKERKINKLTNQVDEKNNELIRLDKVKKFLLSKDQFINHIEELVKPLKVESSNKVKQEIIRALIEKIDIVYHPQLLNFFINIHFKISDTSAIMINAFTALNQYKYNEIDSLIRISDLSTDSITQNFSANIDLDTNQTDIGKTHRWLSDYIK